MVLVRASNVLTKYQLSMQLPVTPTAEETKRGNLPMCRTPTEGRAVSMSAAGVRLICHLQWCVHNVSTLDDIQRNVLIKNNSIYQRSGPSLHTSSGRSYKCLCLQCIYFHHLKHLKKNALFSIHSVAWMHVGIEELVFFCGFLLSLP